MKYAKKISRIRKVVKKRYFRGKGLSNPKFATLSRDVALLKRALNTEKKSIVDTELTVTNIGQSNGNLDTGVAFVDITPQIAQGIGSSQMTGNSVKLVSMAVKGQFKQMSACRHPMKVKIIYFTTRQPMSINTIQSSNLLYDINPITTVTDMASDRNINYFKDFRILKTQVVTLPADPSSGETMIKNFSFVTKLSHHLKWNKDTTTLTDGQICMAFISDSGNSSTTTAASLLNVPIQAINTGATLQYHTKFFYVDN